jgi:hypothetical protein
MSQTPEEAKIKSITGRRSFIKDAAAASLLGTVGASSAALEATAKAEPAPQNGGASDPQTPATLGPHAMLDGRFAITYEDSVPEGVKVVMAHFKALAQRDIRGVADTLHFPFGSVEGTQALKVDTAEELIAHAPASLNMTLNPERFTDHDGYMKAGTYDVFGGLEVLLYDPVKCAMSMVYDRYGSDGKRLLRCEGVYTVTNNDGRWAIQLASTIFTPDLMIGMNYPDTVQASTRWRIDHDLAYQVSDRSVDPISRMTGPSISVSNGEGRAVWQDGPNGKIMPHFKIAGVKTRLVYSHGKTPLTPAQIAARQPSANPIADYADYRALFPMSGVGNWGWVYGVQPATRILHATVDKSHMLSGARRFTAAGEECSWNQDLTVMTYIKGQWGATGHLAYTTPHDRSNDVERRS